MNQEIEVECPYCKKKHKVYIVERYQYVERNW